MNNFDDEYTDGLSRIDTEGMLIKEAQIGIEAEEFRKSDLGQYLHGRAEVDIAQAYKNFETVCPDNPNAIRAIQDQVRVLRMFQRFVDDAIQNGREATARLKIITDQKEW